MFGARQDTWSVLAMMADAAGLVAAILLGCWLLRRRGRVSEIDLPIMIGVALTALFCAASVFFGPNSLIADLAETARNFGWLYLLFRLFEGDGRHESLRPVRLVVIALGFVELLQPCLAVIAAQVSAAAIDAAVFHLSALLRVLFAVGGLVLLHNLYSGASASARLALRWPAIAIAMVWLFDLNFHAIAYLTDTLPRQMMALRGVVSLGQCLVLGLGAQSWSAALRFGPSRTVAFRSISLLVIGVYLALMATAGHWLVRAGGDNAFGLQLGFIAAIALAAALLLTSARVRGWCKVMLAKHLFQHRYDYRGEWLRLMTTIGRRGEDAPSLEQRVIQAIGDITDSGSGILLTPADDGDLQAATLWNWGAAEIPSPALPAAIRKAMQRDAYIIDLDAARAGSADLALPQWLLGDTRAWAMVPLLHFGNLVGVVVLARPAHSRQLDWEDFDLLRVAGQQLASYLAESAGRDALAQSAQFEDFHRRIAFVMHDVKNLASQLALLARNAEQHADNPAFRADMLVTLRNSAEKLNALLARLSRYGGASRTTAGSVDLGAVAEAAAAHAEPGRVSFVSRGAQVMVVGDREALEQAIDHLVRNAIDASTAGQGVFLAVVSDGHYGTLEVLDSGHGMAPEFIRTKLFKPFVSTKTGGFGIGAFEARELVRAMGGMIDVESHEGLGTRFKVRLPLARTTEIIAKIEQSDRKVA